MTRRIEARHFPLFVGSRHIEPWLEIVRVVLDQSDVGTGRSSAPATAQLADWNLFPIGNRRLRRWSWEQF